MHSRMMIKMPLRDGETIIIIIIIIIIISSYYQVVVCYLSMTTKSFLPMLAHRAKSDLIQIEMINYECIQHI